MEVGVLRFPRSQLPLRSKTSPKVCPPCDFITSSFSYLTPPPGVELTPVQ